MKKNAILKHEKICFICVNIPFQKGAKKTFLGECKLLDEHGNRSPMSYCL